MRNFTFVKMTGVNMKKKKDFFIIKLDIYPFEILVSRHSTYRTFRNALLQFLPSCVHKDIDVAFPKGDPSGRSTMFPSGHSVIYLKEVTPGIIAHEAFHITAYIMERIETPLCEDTYEAYAYLLAYLIDRITNWLEEK